MPRNMRATFLARPSSARLAAATQTGRLMPSAAKLLRNSDDLVGRRCITIDMDSGTGLHRGFHWVKRTLLSVLCSEARAKADSFERLPPGMMQAVVLPPRPPVQGQSRWPWSGRLRKTSGACSPLSAQVRKTAHSAGPVSVHGIPRGFGKKLSRRGPGPSVPGFLLGRGPESQVQTHLCKFRGPSTAGIHLRDRTVS